MRKTAILLTSALLLALAAPMVSAAPINVTGEVETRFEITEENDWELAGKTGIKLSPSLHAGDNVKLGMEFETAPNSFSGRNPSGDFDGDHGAMSGALNKVWLETTGAFWQGGPVMKTTIGDMTLNWNDWVGRLGAKRGIAVEGIDLMVADADVFYAWDGSDNPMGVRVNSEVEGVDLDAMVLYKDRDFDVVLGAATEFNGIGFEGNVALDAERNYAFKVGASMEAMEDVTLIAGYRQMQEDFAPMYAHTSGDNVRPFHKDSRDAGFNIGVETVQHGFDLAAAYDQPTEQATLSAARTFDVEGHAIAAAYKATLERDEAIRHELEASTTTDMIPYVPGVGLSAKLTAEGTDVDSIGYEVGTTYTAPNGINLGAKYDSDKGASITGGLKVSF